MTEGSGIVVVLQCPECGPKDRVICFVEPSRSRRGLPLAWCYREVRHRHGAKLRLIEVAYNARLHGKVSAR